MYVVTNHNGFNSITMKHRKLYALFTLIFAGNCLYAQQARDYDTTWKANLTYCINTDEHYYNSQEDTRATDFYFLYNLSLFNSKGNLRNTLDELFNNMITYKWPVFSANIFARRMR